MLAPPVIAHRPAASSRRTVLRYQLSTSHHAIQSGRTLGASATFLVSGEGGDDMSKSKVTGRTAAAAASKVLRDGRTGKASKTAAGSALAQRPKK